MYTTINDAKNPIKLWTDVSTVEDVAINQLINVANLPYIYKHVAVMPDVHYGIGATIGSVIAMKDAISPSAVGVDLGCGMAAVKTNLNASDLPDDLKKIRTDVEWSIPVGRYKHKTAKNADVSMSGFNKLSVDMSKFEQTAALQTGTLGGGNHFVELCLDDNDTVWLMLHSGSRGIGNQLARAHIKTAKALEHNANMADPDLAVFLANTPEMDAYRHDLEWAQDYAMINRNTMMELYKRSLQTFFPTIEYTTHVNCHHNYVAYEHHFGSNVLVTRKGAISARAGQLGIIPGSMGTGSYIVEGLGNPESFNSASHGAGRTMSRTRAKQEFTVDDLKLQTSGVECRKDAGVLDEIPGAYKDIDAVMKNQDDLVKPVAHLRAVMCIKG